MAPCTSTKVDKEIVDGSMASLKVAESVLPMGTPLAPLAGDVEVTVGAVALMDAPVVKVHTKLLAKALPNWSLAAVVIVAVNICWVRECLPG